MCTMHICVCTCKMCSNTHHLKKCFLFEKFSTNHILQQHPSILSCFLKLKFFPNCTYLLCAHIHFSVCTYMHIFACAHMYYLGKIAKMVHVVYQFLWVRSKKKFICKMMNLPLGTVSAILSFIKLQGPFL